jgi:hypothetical protein
VTGRCLPSVSSSRFSTGERFRLELGSWDRADHAGPRNQLRSWSVAQPTRRNDSSRTVSAESPPSYTRADTASAVVFHEVRVPLNTALLAVQNLDGEDVFKGLHEDQSEMVHGLMGSLTMMEKVSWGRLGVCARAHAPGPQ